MNYILSFGSLILAYALTLLWDHVAGFSGILLVSLLVEIAARHRCLEGRSSAQHHTKGIVTLLVAGALWMVWAIGLPSMQLTRALMIGAAFVIISALPLAHLLKEVALRGPRPINMQRSQRLE